MIQNTVNNSQKRSLLQQFQNRLAALIGLRQHTRSGLHNDIIDGIFHHQIRYIGIPNTRLRRLRVLFHIGIDIADMFDTVLVSTEGRTLLADHPQSAFDLVDSISGAFLRQGVCVLQALSLIHI